MLPPAEIASENIFAFLERAITMAACKYPEDFLLRRDGIAQLLYKNREGVVSSKNPKVGDICTMPTQAKAPRKEKPESKTLKARQPGVKKPKQSQKLQKIRASLAQMRNRQARLMT